MKKILIALISLCVIFGFVACDNSGSTPAESAVAKAGDDTIDITIFSDATKVSDFQSDVVIYEDGSVDGTFDYATLEKWGVPGETAGYYVCVVFDVPEGAAVKVVGDGEKSAVDDEWVLFLDADPEEAKKSTFKVSYTPVDGEETDLITLSFAESTFNPVE